MQYISYVAVGAVLVVLLMGLVNMFRGGSSNTSQKLMRWRVGLQFVAIIVLMASLYFSQR
jgi:hypothetical protein